MRTGRNLGVFPSLEVFKTQIINGGEDREGGKEGAAGWEPSVPQHKETRQPSGRGGGGVGIGSCLSVDAAEGRKLRRGER